MLAIAVFCALQDAISATADYLHYPLTDSPATPERVLAGIQKLREARDGQ